MLNALHNSETNSIVNPFEINSEMREEIGGIQSLKNYEELFENKRGKLSYSYNRWLLILRRIEERIFNFYKINIDPIEYIMYLYSKDGEGKNTEQIYNQLNHNKLLKFENGASLNHFFEKILKWNVKEDFFSTEKGGNKIDENKSNENKSNENKSDTEELKINKLTSSLKKLKLNKRDAFPVDKLALTEKTTDKIKLILDNRGFISEDKFDVTMKNLFKKFGLNITVSAIQNILDGIPQANGIKYEGINLTKEIKNEIGGINNLDDFEKKYSNNNGRLNKTYKNTYAFFKKIQDYIIEEYNNNDLDPIEYLMYLYSKDGEGIPINELYKKFGKFSVSKHQESFRKIFKSTLGWKLRDCNERTNYSKEKFDNKMNDRIIKGDLEFEKYFGLIFNLDNVNGSIDKTFYQNFSEIETNQDKIVFAMANFLNVSTIEIMSNILLLKESGVPVSAISRGIDTFVNEKLYKSLKLNIKPDIIKNIIRKFNKNN